MADSKKISLSRQRIFLSKNIARTVSVIGGKAEVE
jgi:hypothetical protein